MKHNMGMKRAGAYIIDTWICGVLLAACTMPFMLNRFLQDPLSKNLGPGIMSMSWMLAMSCGALLLYSIIGDLCGGTIGKRIFGIRIEGENGPVKTFGFALKHGVMKVGLSIVWPISAVYCLAQNGALFYDNWLKVKLVDTRPI